MSAKRICLFVIYTGHVYTKASYFYLKLREENPVRRGNRNTQEINIAAKTRRNMRALGLPYFLVNRYETCHQQSAPGIFSQ